MSIDLKAHTLSVTLSEKGTSQTYAFNDQTTLENAGQTGSFG
jgi:hypothetical protein